MMITTRRPEGCMHAADTHDIPLQNEKTAPLPYIHKPKTGMCIRKYIYIYGQHTGARQTPHTHANDE